MATYKVIQDIEAEDKLLGPLTLRQFIYAAITAVLGFIIFKLAFSGSWFVAIPFLPPTIFFAFLAAPFGHDQPSEVWMLAKVRFALKPRRRIWDQSGMSELVTVTAPKVVEHNLSNGLSQTEVHSRLQALADTIDSRGWAAANRIYGTQQTDRLVAPYMMPREVPVVDTAAIHDVMDENTSPTAQHFDQMIAQSQQYRREQIDVTMQQAAAPVPQQQNQSKTKAPSMEVPITKQSWFLQLPDAPTEEGISPFDNPAVVKPGTATGSTLPTGSTTAEEEAVLQKIHEEQSEPKPVMYHMKVVEPLKGEKTDDSYGEDETPEVTPPNRLPFGMPPIPSPMGISPPAVSPSLPTPVIMNMARDNNKFVSTLAREADQYSVQASDNEVVLTLSHDKAA